MFSGAVVSGIVCLYAYTPHPSWRFNHNARICFTLLHYNRQYNQIGKKREREVYKAVVSSQVSGDN